MLTQLINKTEKTKTHPSVFINLFFLVIVCALLIRLSLQLFGNHNSSYSNNAPNAEQTTVEFHPKKDIQEQHIASLHLFGMPSYKPEDSSAQITPEPVNAPETALNLTLKGIAAERIKLKSRVIIHNNNTNKEEFFAIRDNVFDLATVEDIYDDRVLLVRKGKYETLFLPKEKLSNDLANKRNIDDAYKIGITSFLNNTIKQYDPTLTYPVSLDTIYRKGQLVGYSTRIQQHDKNNVIRDLGLEEGDLITAFNGIVFADQAETTFSSTEASNLTSGEIEILRNNDTHTLYLELDNYNSELYAGENEDGNQAYDISDYNPESDYYPEADYD